MCGYVCVNNKKKNLPLSYLHMEQSKNNIC